jgi:ribonucleoside-diphosphate reductase alpha chain
MELAKLEDLTQHLKGLQLSGEFQHNLWNIKDEDLSRWDGSIKKRSNGARSS